MKEKKLWQNENYLDSFDPGTFNLHKKKGSIVIHRIRAWREIIILIWRQIRNFSSSSYFFIVANWQLLKMIAIVRADNGLLVCANIEIPTCRSWKAQTNHLQLTTWALARNGILLFFFRPHRHIFIFMAS